MALGTLLILILPPMVFSHVEGWSFSEGFYFAFITLSTIGFGDYVVGEKGAATDHRVGATGIRGGGDVSRGKGVILEDQRAPGYSRETNTL